MIAQRNSIPWPSRCFRNGPSPQPHPNREWWPRLTLVMVWGLPLAQVARRARSKPQSHGRAPRRVLGRRVWKVWNDVRTHLPGCAGRKLHASTRSSESLTRWRCMCTTHRLSAHDLAPLRYLGGSGTSLRHQLARNRRQEIVGNLLFGKCLVEQFGDVWTPSLAGQRSRRPVP